MSHADCLYNTVRDIGYKFNPMRILTVLMVLTTTLLFGQSRDEIDKFTGKRIQETDWYNIAGGGFKFKCVNIRAGKIDSTAYIDLKLMMNNTIYSISRGDEFMFKLANGNTITLKSLDYQITCKGCGATGFVGSDGWGTNTRYYLSKPDLIDLALGTVTDFRIYTSKGYLEEQVSGKTVGLIQGIFSSIKD